MGEINSLAPGKKFQVINLFVSDMLYNLATLLPPIATSGIIAVLTERGSFTAIWFYVVLYLVFYFFQFAFLEWNYHIYIDLSHHYYNVVQQELFEHIVENDGILEHWTCANEPGVYYGDEACTFTLESTVVYAFGHDYRAPTYTWKEVNGGYECTATITCTHCHDEISETQVATKVIVRDSTCSREGQISYSVRFNDERFNAQNKLVNLEKAPHNYVHVDEIAATESMDGIKEHYECSECHKCFVKDGEDMKEVQYTDLFYKYKAPSSSGCGGSIATPSLVILASAGALTLLLVLRRKEER